MKQIMRTKILVMERHAAVRTLEAKQRSQVKDPFGELVSNWLVTTLAALGFLLAMCCRTVYCADCFSQWSIERALARAGTTKPWADRNKLFWTVRDKVWVVVAPDVEELRSWVDATSGSSTLWRYR